ncbi:hypothetical protein GF323_02080 [Candidatus Woesearchaeota archaeon]|nr:hypothetical protein [Candidatus Woesearchaeota archaeon]
MPTVDTALSPREILNRIYSSLRSAYSKVLSARPGDVKADESMAADINTMEKMQQKLSYSFVRKLKDDANVDAKSFEKLKELERLLEEIVSEKKTAIRQEHYVYRIAKRLRNVVKGKARKTRKQGIRELSRVRKEKKQLARREKEAKEKASK